jgi:FkbM family methyltransferase
LHRPKPRHVGLGKTSESTYGKGALMPSPVTLNLLRLLGHLDWLAFGVRDRIFRYFVNPDTVEGQEFETEFFGWKYQGNLNTFIDWSVYFYGAYEKDILFLMRDIVKEKANPIFIDVGANVGHHSLFMSKLCQEVHAFEPYDRVRDILISKLLFNKCSNIVVHNVGLGDKSEFLDFYAPVGRNVGTGSFMAEHAKDNNIKLGKLEIVEGDLYISNLNLNKIDLIKIDVEGFEKFVLLGLRDTLEKYRPSVVMEYSRVTRDNLTIQQLREILPGGYNIQGITTNRTFCLLFNRMNYHLIDFDPENPKIADLLLSPN